MPLLTLILIIIAAGVLLYAVTKYVPMDPAILRLLQVVVILAIVLIILQAFGALDALKGVRVGR